MSYEPQVGDRVRLRHEPKTWYMTVLWVGREAMVCESYDGYQRWHSLDKDWVKAREHLNTPTFYGYVADDEGRSKHGPFQNQSEAVQHAADNQYDVLVYVPFVADMENATWITE